MGLSWNENFRWLLERNAVDGRILLNIRDSIRDAARVEQAFDS